MNEEINNILNNINGYPLDNDQRKIVLSQDKYLLVSAGAGSGKTLTILGKIRYLIEIKHLKEEQIICISFTNEATNNLKESIKKNFNYNINCYTFHKLSLEILKKEKYTITETNTLRYIINEFFENIIYFNKDNIKKALKFLKIKYSIFNYKKKYKTLKANELNQLKNLIEKFINLYKSNDYKNKDFLFFLKEAKKKRNYKKNSSFLILTFYIYYIYEKELSAKKEIDFNDMIKYATNYIKKENYNNKIKYIIIDEFQDTSHLRFNLIKSIIEKTNANLLVVGDDFQSIYRFTGCDLNIFLNFKKMFNNANILKIENTYRNSQELIDIAGSFVMKNKNQLKKDLKSNKHENYPINIIYYSEITTTFIKLIEKIYQETKKAILILGRNNFDINEILKNKYFILEKEKLIYRKNCNIKMTYLTVHRSKGLEEENVILINLKNDKLGFPNKIEDDEVLKYVSCKEDNYPFSEERRLFYVALTRTKNKNYLLVPKNNESIFIKELKATYKEKIKVLKL